MVVLSSSCSTSGDSSASAQSLTLMGWVSLLNSQKTNPIDIRGMKVFCPFWGSKLNPLGARWGPEVAQGGGRGASWGLPASRPAGLWVRPCSWEPAGTEPPGWCQALKGTEQKVPPSCEGQRHKAVSWRQPGCRGFCKWVWKRKPACLVTTSGRLFPACSVGTQLYERRH